MESRHHAWLSHIIRCRDQDKCVFSHGYLGPHDMYGFSKCLQLLRERRARQQIKLVNPSYWYPGLIHNAIVLWKYFAYEIFSVPTRLTRFPCAHPSEYYGLKTMSHVACRLGISTGEQRRAAHSLTQIAASSAQAWDRLRMHFCSDTLHCSSAPMCTALCCG